MNTSAKHKSISSAMLLAIGFLMLVASAAAQVKTYTINVPFDFRTAAQAYPAGEYRVTEITQGAVLLRSLDNTVYSFILTSSISDRADRILPAMLVFHRYGHEYFLAEIWFNSNTGGKAPVSNAELEYAKLSQKVDTKLLASTK